MKRILLSALALAALLLPPGAARAQSHDLRAVADSDAGTAFAGRRQLEARRDSLAAVVRSQDAGSTVVQAREEVARIDRRLEKGDFQPGDVVQLAVRGDPALTGKFAVQTGPVLELPGLDNVNLSGVLFSEADSVITASLAVYLRHPNVQVRVLRRLAVVGGVNRPGFYEFPPSTTLAQVIMAAGGPAPKAKLMDMEFRRDGKDLLQKDPADVRPDLTLADLGARRGDQLYLPEKGKSFPLAVFGVVGSLAGVTWALVQILR